MKEDYKFSEALLWDELADIYDAPHPHQRQARTLYMGVVFDWVERQSDYKVLNDGTIHRVIRNNTNKIKSKANRQ